MPPVYDAIIAGGGPAGASAAYFLAETGWRVLLLERAVPPRYKACGGGLSARALAGLFPFDFEPVIEASIQSVRWIRDGRAATFPVGRHAIRTVMRDRFDATLLAHTRAEVRTGVAVRRVREQPESVIVETASGERLEAAYLIGADGAASIVAREAGLRRGKSMAGALEVELPASPDALRRLGGTLHFIFGDVRLGYAWVFPKASVLSVGIMGLRPRPGELQAGLRRLAARFGLSLEGAAIHGHPIPLYQHPERLMTRRILLVGDAAGLADPLSGEGIRLALKSGQLAAQALVAGRPRRYPWLIWRDMGLSHIISGFFLQLYGLAPDLLFDLGACNPWITQALMAVLADRATFVRVFFTALWSVPIQALRVLLGRAHQSLPGSAQLAPNSGQPASAPANPPRPSP
jgi:geranylgeranyl reductase family protein